MKMANKNLNLIILLLVVVLLILGGCFQADNSKPKDTDSVSTTAPSAAGGSGDADNGELTPPPLPEG